MEQPTTKAKQRAWVEAMIEDADYQFREHTSPRTFRLWWMSRALLRQLHNRRLKTAARARYPSLTPELKQKILDVYWEDPLRGYESIARQLGTIAARVCEAVTGKRT